MSALTRLLEGLPSEYYDDGRLGQAATIMAGLGGSMLAVGAVLGITGLSVGEAGLIAGSAGPVLAGAINLGLGILFKKRADATKKIQLTADARQLDQMFQRSRHRSG
ncbi:hypothetical protein EON81_22260, partial [bacterium]